jgi:hypothetical protein
MGWWFPVDKPTPDKQVIAGKIRAALEKRLGTLLGCNGRDLPKMRLGELVHLAFLLWDGEEIGGFNPTVSAIATRGPGHNVGESGGTEVGRGSGGELMRELVTFFGKI